MPLELWRLRSTALLMVGLIPASACTGSGTVTSTRVPVVVGRRVGVAEGELRARHLTWRIVIQRHAPPVNPPPSGTVLVQQPSGGTVLKQGTEIRLVVMVS